TQDRADRCRARVAEHRRPRGGTDRRGLHYRVWVMTDPADRDDDTTPTGSAEPGSTEPLTGRTGSGRTPRPDPGTERAAGAASRADDSPGGVPEASANDSTEGNEDSVNSVETDFE